MTDRFKEALAVLPREWHDDMKHEGQCWLEQHLLTIREALTLAQDYERVKKERNAALHAGRFFAEHCLISNHGKGDYILNQIAKDFIDKFEKESE